MMTRKKLRKFSKIYLIKDENQEQLILFLHYVKIPLAETPRHDDIVADKENVLGTVFV